MNKFDAFGEDRELLGRDEDYPPAPSVAVPEGEAKPFKELPEAYNLVSDLLGKYLNTMVADLRIEGKGQYLRDLFSQYEAELRATPPTNPVSTEKWRVGRKLGRTLYIGDRFIGSVDTPELASQIVEAVNAGGVSKTFQSAEDFVAANFDGADGSYYAKGDRAMRLLFDVEVAQAYGNYVMEFMRGVSTAWLPAPGDWLLAHPNYDKWPRRNDSQISTLDDIQFNWITVVKLMSEYAAHVLAEKGKR